MREYPIYIDGHAALSTTELNKRIGVHVPTPILKAAGAVPILETSNGIYWREDDLPVIATQLSVFFITRARDLQSEWIRSKHPEVAARETDPQVQALAERLANLF